MIDLSRLLIVYLTLELLAAAEPRSSNPAFDVTRPAHLIEPDPTSDSADLENICFNIPTPKTTSKPASWSPT